MSKASMLCDWTRDGSICSSVDPCVVPDKETKREDWLGVRPSKK
jgi:hypothetical protein